jgi:hypothetical protein
MNVPEGGVWEEPDWELRENWSPDERARQYYHACRHVQHFIWPLVVVAKNEARHNSTGVCALCISEAVHERTT